MNYLQILIIIPYMLFLCLACASYSLTFIILIPLKHLFPNFYFKLDTIAVKSLVNIISAAFNIGNCEVYEYGEDISEFEKENCLLLVNHQSTVDVPIIMHLFNSKKYLIFNSSWMLDDIFKYVPFGWVSILRNDVFVKQGRQTRNQQLSLLADKFKYSFTELKRKWLVIFPEGGFFYKRIASSKSYALKNGFPNLDYVTLPRLGAVEMALQTLSVNSQPIIKTNSDISSDISLSQRPEVALKDRIKYIIDITIAYQNINSAPSFLNMAMGSESQHPVYLYYRIYDIDKIPIASSYELQKWMYQIYKEKNDRLEAYYTTGKFDHLESDIKEIPPKRLMNNYKEISIAWESILFSALVMCLWSYLWFGILLRFVIDGICSMWCTASLR